MGRKTEKIPSFRPYRGTSIPLARAFGNTSSTSAQDALAGSFPPDRPALKSAQGPIFLTLPVWPAPAPIAPSLSGEASAARVAPYEAPRKKPLFRHPHSPKLNARALIAGWKDISLKRHPSPPPLELAGEESHPHGHHAHLPGPPVPPRHAGPLCRRACGQRHYGRRLVGRHAQLRCVEGGAAPIHTDLRSTPTPLLSRSDLTAACPISGSAGGEWLAWITWLIRHCRFVPPRAPTATLLAATLDPPLTAHKTVELSRFIQRSAF